MVITTTNAAIARTRTGIPATCGLATLKHVPAISPVVDARGLGQYTQVHGMTMPSLVATAAINGNATTRLAPLEEVPV